ncbi:phosphate acetyltransferase [Buchnera aphidicola]|uniref:Phosphate acetyltransferase n=1 Tax=Buchnera aphidicola (Cinara strobi) TaxID=1921549 RepID=A0A3B1E0A9_9GAMM|nr:phosphate acetyltransferase [Buchnera aphidicola]VAX76405.1 Phosphate acetyltransferase [Buchnera aphidicola (Cinara strobi)]
MKNYSRDFKLFLKKQASLKVRTIVFPEGNNLKIIKSVSICSKLKISKCILLGDSSYIKNMAVQNNIVLNDNILIINPDSIRKNYVDDLFKLRKNKDIFNRDQALNKLNDNVILSIMMLYLNDVDGVVAGITRPTAEIIRPTFQIIQNGCKDPFVSSVFLMLFLDKVLVYGDCAINRYPNSTELAKIAIQSANTASSVGIFPSVAMLSYSTGSSSSGASVDRISHSLEIIKKIKPELLVDGPIQYDAAISKEIANIKLPESQVAGQATVLIFPDLNSGNITYKAVQQTAKITSIGPILQGLKKPVNDLSRGASVDDVVYTTAMTVIQSF